MIVNPALEEGNGRKTLISPHYVADIVSVGWVSKEKSVVGMNLPEASVMMAKEIIQGGYKIGKDLGRNCKEF